MTARDDAAAWLSEWNAGQIVKAGRAFDALAALLAEHDALLARVAGLVAEWADDGNGYVASCAADLRALLPGHPK